MTPTAVQKGALVERDILHLDESGRPVGKRPGRPSAETALHLAIVRSRSAGAVLHTHSVWATILSELHAGRNELILEGYEMLKGLAGVATHDHRERVPIIDNDQNVIRLAGVVGELLAREPAVHGFLLRGHGLYTWGATLEEAARHVEIFEFLFEAAGRRSQHGSPR
jgi:methylthioribulose-1-phosphate dehydratase